MVAASRRALLTFAFVSEALKSHQDLIVGLAPLFNPIATDLSGHLFAPEELCAELARRYDLPISPDVASYMSSSLHKVGLLKRKDIGSSDVSFFWTAPPHPTANMPLDLERKIEQLGDAVTGFAAQNPSLLTWRLTNENALDLIFDWVIDQDKELRAAEIAYGSKIISSSEESATRKRLKSEQEYFCARFISWLKRTNSDLYDTLSDVGNAVIVSEVVLELRTPSISTQANRELYIYVDAPVAMDALNCSGSARKEQASYLIERLRDLGANILIMSHSIEEMKESLRAVLRNPSGERTGPSAAALIRREIPEEYLWSVLRDPEKYLSQANIGIFDVERTPLPPNYTQVFPDDYFKELLSRLHPHYKRFEAAERDALSAAIIMRRRARQKSNDLFRTRHVMITRNPMVSTVTRAYCRELDLIGADNLGPLVNVREVAAIVWLAVGTQQKREISRRQLVLSCSRALESAPEVIQQFRKKLKEIKPENAEIFDALITEPRNLQIAMDFAQGTTARAIESDPEVLFSKLTAQVGAEAKQAYAREKSDLVRKHKEELARIESTRKELAEQIALLEADKEKALVANIASAMSLFNRSCGRIRVSISIAKWALAVVVLLLTFFTSSILLEPLDKAWVAGWTLFLSGLLAFIVAITILVDPRSLFERLAKKVWQNWFAKQLRIQNLVEASGQIEFDWANLSCREKLRRQVDTIL